MNIYSKVYSARLACTAITLLLINGCASYGPPQTGAVAGPEKRTSTLLANDVREIVLELPVGDVEVIATSDSQVSAELQIRCDQRNKGCQKLANDITLKQQVFEDRMFIGPSKRSKMAYRKTQSDYLIRVPSHVPLRIVMGYGELNVKGTENDLTIDMTAGEISVEAPLAQIRRVWADANFGDARLRGASTTETGGRRFLVGAESSWVDGPGRHAIVVNLGAGDINVSLTP